MHTILVILGGIVALGLFLLFGRLWGGGTVDLAVAAKAFIPVWLAVCAVNLWIGVSKAGYTVGEEFPILLVVFAAPSVFAVLAIWRFEH
jgi:hypothetical protein